MRVNNFFISAQRPVGIMRTDSGLAASIVLLLGLGLITLYIPHIRRPLVFYQTPIDKHSARFRVFVCICQIRYRRTAQNTSRFGNKHFYTMFAYLFARYRSGAQRSAPLDTASSVFHVSAFRSCKTCGYIVFSEFIRKKT